MKSLQMVILVYFILGLSSHLEGQIRVDPANPKFIMVSGDAVLQDGTPDLASTLANFQNQSMLELTLAQREQLNKSILEIGKENFKAMQYFVESGDSEETRSILTKRYKLNSQTFSAGLNSTLLPTQVEYAKNMAFSHHLSSVGLDGLKGSPVGRKLGLTNEESKKLRKKVKEVNKALKEEIARITKQAEFAIIESLPERCKKILEKDFGRGVLENPSDDDE